LQTTPTSMNIVQVYAPASQHSEDEVKEFYSQIGETLKKLRKLQIVMKDGIEKGRVDHTTGKE
ncbi:hypothetical protein Trydic_g8916, partial [Trypoxylus dichotomus]